MVIKFPLMSSTTLPVETRLDATVLISVVRVCPVVTRLVVKVEMSESLLVIWVCNVWVGHEHWFLMGAWGVRQDSRQSNSC